MDPRATSFPGSSLFLPQGRKREDPGNEVDPRGDSRLSFDFPLRKRARYIWRHFYVSVRLLTIKISQWARENFAVIVKTHFVEIIKLQLKKEEKQTKTKPPSIVTLCRIIVSWLSLKNAWLIPIFFSHFNSPSLPWSGLLSRIVINVAKILSNVWRKQKSISPSCNTAQSFSQVPQTQVVCKRHDTPTKTNHSKQEMKMNLWATDGHVKTHLDIGEDLNGWKNDFFFYGTFKFFFLLLGVGGGIIQRAA